MKQCSKKFLEVLLRGWQEDLKLGYLCQTITKFVYLGYFQDYVNCCASQIYIHETLQHLKWVYFCHNIIILQVMYIFIPMTYYAITGMEFFWILHSCELLVALVTKNFTKWFHWQQRHGMWCNFILLASIWAVTKNLIWIEGQQPRHNYVGIKKI